MHGVGIEGEDLALYTWTGQYESPVILGGEYTIIDEVDDIVGEMLRSAGAEYFKSEFGKYMREKGDFIK